MRKSIHNIFAVLLVLLVFGCSNEETMRDQGRLDVILSQAASLSIEVKCFEGTNLISRLINSEDSKKFLEALAETNRLVVDVRQKKRVSSWIEFSKETNFISRISIFDDGVFHFHQYNFKLKSPLGGSLLFTNAPFRLMGK